MERSPTPLQRTIRVIGMGTACILAAFIVGFQTAGDVEPVKLIEAGSNTQRGDVNADGTVDQTDVDLLLELIINNEYDPYADMNGDGELDIFDVDWLNEQLMTQ